MAVAIGRLGYLGLGIESSPGSAVAASVWLPYTDISLREHHEPIENIQSKASRYMDTDSVVGKRWGEGDVQINLDILNSGYLFKCALGAEGVVSGSNPYVHTFYPTVSGNTPGATATLIQGRDTDVQQYTYGTIDELSMEVSDGLATITGSFLTDYPVATTAGTPTTTSGTVVSFKDLAVQFGATLTLAAAASTTPVNELSVSIANNAEVIHRSGSSTVSMIRTKGLRVTGSYTVYFDSVTERDAYYALNKRSMILKFTGTNANEYVQLRIARFRLSEAEISTGLDDFFVVKSDWVAEDVVDATGVRLMDVKLSNTKSAVY